MPNGTPTTTFEKALEVAKQFGIPVLLAGVLLWFHFTRVLRFMEDGRATQLDMRAAQVSIQRQVDYWIAHGCQPAPPMP